MKKDLKGLNHLLSLSCSGLLVCALAQLTACTQQTPQLLLTQISEPPARLQILLRLLQPASKGFSQQTLNQPLWQHRAEDIRSLRFELFDCSTLAAAQSNDPAGQAACLPGPIQTENYPAGVLASQLSLDIGNLKQGRFYTLRASAYAQADAAGALLGSAWPDRPVNANREVINVAADGLLSLSNAPAGAEQLVYTLQLGSPSISGGSVTGNSLVIS